MCVSKSKTSGATIYVGDRLIIQLGRDDALAAGDVSLRVHARVGRFPIRDGLRVEEHRVGLLKTGITLLIVLVSGILALFLLRRVGRLGRRGRTWLNEQPNRVPLCTSSRSKSSARRRSAGSSCRARCDFSLFSFKSASPTAGSSLRCTSSSPPASTPDDSPGIVLTPLTGFMSKVGSSLPVLVIATASIAALVVLVRFVGAFFDSAARGETAIGWVPPDLVERHQPGRAFRHRGAVSRSCSSFHHRQ